MIKKLGHFLFVVIVVLPFTVCKANIVLVEVQPSVMGGSTGTIEILAKGDAGPFTIYLEDMDGNIVNNQTGQPHIYENVDGGFTIEGVPAGTYRVKVVDRHGCENFLDVIVDETEFECDIVVIVEEFQHVSECLDEYCGGDSPPWGCKDDGRISINVLTQYEGQYEVTWKRSNGVVVSNMEDFSNVSVGRYILEVKTTINSEDCPPHIQEFIIEACEDLRDIEDFVPCEDFGVTYAIFNPVKNVEITGSEGSNDCTGVLDPDFPSYPRNFSFYWENVGTGERYNDKVLDGLCPGDYCLHLDGGCSEPIELCYEVVDCSLNPVVISLDEITNTCEGVPFGGINITVSGGTPKYEYLWSNRDENEDLVDVIGGTYSVTVTDMNGCKDTDEFSIENAYQVMYQDSDFPCKRDFYCNNRFIPDQTINVQYDCSEPTSTNPNPGNQISDNSNKNGLTKRMPDCRDFNCYCPITGNYVGMIKQDYLSLRLGSQGCVIEGLCPDGSGQWVEAERGFELQGGPFPAQDPSCSTNFTCFDRACQFSVGTFPHPNANKYCSTIYYDNDLTCSTNCVALVYCGNTEITRFCVNSDRCGFQGGISGNIDQEMINLIKNNLSDAGLLIELDLNSEVNE